MPNQQNNQPKSAPSGMPNKSTSKPDDFQKQQGQKDRDNSGRMNSPGASQGDRSTSSSRTSTSQQDDE